MSLERIIITFERNGDLRGASSTDFDGLPVHLVPEELEKKITTLNASAVARVIVADDEIATLRTEKEQEIASKEQEILSLTTQKDEVIALLTTEKDRVKSVLVVIESAIADPDIPDEATLQIAKAEIEKSKLTEKEKEAIILRAEIKEREDKLAAITAEPIRP